MDLLNFGPEFRGWKNLFFRDRETYLMMDGFMGEKITLEQGVPQGDLLSPYIFNIAIEGIKFARCESRAETYTDDTTIIIKRTEANLRNLVKIIQDFAKISGLRANLDKTKYLKDFSEISGLHCNLDKTSVIPIGTEMDITDDNIIRVGG